MYIIIMDCIGLDWKLDPCPTNYRMTCGDIKTGGVLSAVACTATCSANGKKCHKQCSTRNYAAIAATTTTANKYFQYH